MKEKKFLRYHIHTEIETCRIVLTVFMNDGTYFDINMSVEDSMNIKRDLEKAIDHILENT